MAINLDVLYNPSATRTTISAATTLSAQATYCSITSTGASYTIKLPSIASCPLGHMIYIKDVGGDLRAFPITVQRADATANTIDGATTFVMRVPRQALILVSDGVSNWEIN